MNALKTILLSALLIMFFAAPVVAAGVGDKIPHDLSVKDQNGDTQSFNALSGEKGAVLIFVRSADWCPYCQVQLLDLRFDAKPVVEAGYSIVTVSYDSVDQLKRFADKYKFPYTMLSDEGSEIIKAFDILNTEIDPKSDRYGIPHPAVFIVSKDGFITDKLGDGSVRKRAQAEAILEAINK